MGAPRRSPGQYREFSIGARLRVGSEVWQPAGEAEGGGADTELFCDGGRMGDPLGLGLCYPDSPGTFAPGPLCGGNLFGQHEAESLSGCLKDRICQLCSRTEKCGECGGRTE